MADTMLRYQCPKCTGPMHFDTGKQMVICDYCESEYPESYFAEKEKKTSDAEISEKDEQVDWSKEGFVREKEESMGQQCGFTCSSCSAEVISDGNTAATECMYCGNPIVLTDNVTGIMKPDMVIPFKLDKKAAEEKLLGFYNKKILLPKAFKDANRIKKIVGMYVPFWLFSAKGVGDIAFTGETSSSRRSGDYVITTTKHYVINREGSLDFVKIPVDASLKMEDNYMDGLEPYNYADLKEFSPSYMAGFFADKFDVDVEECGIRAIKRVKNTTRQSLKDTVKGYSNVRVSTENLSMEDRVVNYAMLPVWMLNTKYNDKMYHFAINGQTGKVSGDLPIDKKRKRAIFWLSVLAGYVPLALLSFLLFLR